MASSTRATRNQIHQFGTQGVKMQSLEAELNALCNEQPLKTGLYLKDLTTGREFHRCGHDVFPSVSTRKVSIMMAALSAAHRRQLDLSEEVTLEERQKDDVVSGTLQGSVAKYDGRRGEPRRQHRQAASPNRLAMKIV